MNRIWVLFPLMVTITGCGEVDSAELATDQIDASITVRASERAQSAAVAALKEGFDDVVLTGGDRLTLTTNLDPEHDFERGLLGIYRAELDEDATEATVTLHREVDAGASSVVSIPPRLALATPLEGATLSLTEGEVIVTWSNPLDGAEVDVWTIACGATGGGLGLYPEDPSDTGSITLDPNELGVAGECVSIVITRTVPGAIDSSLHEDSSIEAKRDEQFDVMLAP